MFVANFRRLEIEMKFESPLRKLEQSRELSITNTKTLLELFEWLEGTVARHVQHDEPREIYNLWNIKTHRGEHFSA
jgi:hypothetical protein